MSSTAGTKHPANAVVKLNTRHTLQFDSDFLKATAKHLLDVEVPKITNVLELRAFSDVVLSLTHRATPWPSPDKVSETQSNVATRDGAHIGISRFATPQQREPPREGKGVSLRAAVFYIHGGGMVSSSVEIFRPMLLRSVEFHGVQIFAPDYRLAPENRAPGPVEDCFAALTWLSEHARSMQVDPARIIVMGDSAGGGIAAGLALMARDQGLSPPLAKQVLVYPMIDDRTRYPEDWPLRSFLGWNESDNAIGWGAYLGEDKAGKEDADVSLYAAPGRATVGDLVGLPRTYIDVGGLDLFRDDDLQYAVRLSAANVEVEFHLYPGVPHGFDNCVGAAVTERAMGNRKRAIQSV